MKHLFSFVIPLAFAFAFALSCTLETSGNGKLDGQWHLTDIESLSQDSAQSAQSGGVEHVKERRLYWLVQNNLLQFRDRSEQNTSFLLRFERTGDSLRLFNPYVYDRDNGDKVLEDPLPLLPFGMEALDVTYHIDRLSDSHLVLSTNTLRLYFNKM